MGTRLPSLTFIKWLVVLGLLVAGCSPPNRVTAELQPETPALVASPSALPSPTQIPTATALIPTDTATITPTATLAPTPTITPLPPQLIDAFGIPMVLVPAGPFVMGTEDRAGNERPAHTVTLNSYYIDQFEATNTAFAEFLNAKGNQMEGLANWIEAKDLDLRVHQVDGVWQVDPGYEKYPMNEVTWYGARAFCEWRGARLPTEAEWEKAARGTDERTFPWGEEISCENANYAGCVHASVPVDSFPESVSPYGAYNMAGNMMEWVADWYDIEYYANSPAENPTGPETGNFKVFRGGSWINNSGNTRTTYRFPKLPVLTYTTTGFRCASDIP